MRGSTGQAARPALLGLAILFVAFNMRPALTTVGPLLDVIRAETGLSAAGVAWLNTLPVLCLGLACATGPLVIRRFGTERGVLLAVLVIAAGSALRGLGGTSPLFAGACLAAAGIGLANVLLPGLVKRDFPTRIGVMTGLYTMALCLGAAAGSGLSVPLAQGFGDWLASLAFWAAPALAAALVWAPFARARPDAATSRPPPRRPLWRSPLAWQVTAFMGLQSSLAYTMFGWLPAVLQDRGFSAQAAGFMVSLMSLGQAPSALLVPTLAARARDQRAFVVALMLISALPFVGIAFGPVGMAAPFAALIGVGIGGAFGLGLTLIVLRARDATDAASLSAMSQSLGYTIAALGPLGFGLAHNSIGGWGASTLLYCAIAGSALVFGLGAGRARFVGSPPLDKSVA